MRAVRKYEVRLETWKDRGLERDEVELRLRSGERELEVGKCSWEVEVSERRSLQAEFLPYMMCVNGDGDVDGCESKAVGGVDV